MAVGDDDTAVDPNSLSLGFRQLSDEQRSTISCHYHRRGVADIDNRAHKFLGAFQTAARGLGAAFEATFSHKTT